MYFQLLKKELKQFFRSKGEMVMLFIFPIVLITTLSIGLKDMMSNMTNIFSEDKKDNKVYYSVEDDSIYKEGFNAFIKEVGNELNIDFIETKSLEDVKKDIDSYDAISYIGVNKDDFSYYSSKDGEKTKSKVVRSIFETSLNNFAVHTAIGELNPESLRNIVNNAVDEYVVEEGIGDSRDITAAEYYTFAEIALIILYISVTIAESVYKENSLTTINRLRLSKISERTILLSKISLGIIISIIQTFLVYLYSTFCLDVNWGDNTLKLILLFIVFGVFASALGAIVGILAKKETAVSGVLNLLIIIICFLGGCYTTMSMMVAIPGINTLMYLSPIYWINVAINSMLCNIQSNSYIIALSIPIVLSVIMISLYLVSVKKREVR